MRVDSAAPMPPTVERAAVRRIGIRLFGATLAVYLATAGGSLGTTDAVVTFDLTESLVARHSIALSGDLLGNPAFRGRDGRFYSPFGIGQSIYNIPFYLAGTLANRLVGDRMGKPDALPKAAVALGNTLVSAAAVWLIFLFAWRVSHNRRGALIAGLVAGFATAIWPHAKFGFNQPLTSACLLAGIYAAWLGAREYPSTDLLWSGVWLGGAFLTRHEMGLALPIVWLWIAGASRTDRRQLVQRTWRLALGPLAAAILWVVYNQARFGNPIDTGYLRDRVPEFGSPFLAGLYGLLVSPTASLFLYSPAILIGVVSLVALFRSDRSTATLFAGLSVAFLLFYATLGNWMGGRSYGSRYLVPILPYLCVPLASWLGQGGRARTRLLAGVALLSLLVQLPGVLVDFSKVQLDYALSIPRSELAVRRGSWEASPLVLNTEAAVLAVGPNVRYLLGLERPPAIETTGQAESRMFAQQFSFSLDFWWLYGFYLGVLPAPAAIGIGALLLVVAAWLGRPLVRVPRHANGP